MNLSELKSVRQAGKDNLLELAASVLRDEPGMPDTLARDIEDKFDLRERAARIIGAEIESLERVSLSEKKAKWRKLNLREESGVRFVTDVDVVKGQSCDLTIFDEFSKFFKDKGQKDEEI